MNAHDSERLAGLLDEAGYRPAPDGPSTRRMISDAARPSATEPYTPANATTRRRVRPKAERLTKPRYRRCSRPAG